MGQLMDDIVKTANSFAENFILVAGEPDFSVSIKAWKKVREYIQNGAEDSMPFYILGYKEHIEKGKEQKGYTVLIV